MNPQKQTIITCFALKTINHLYDFYGFHNSVPQFKICITERQHIIVFVVVPCM